MQEGLRSRRLPEMEGTTESGVEMILTNLKIEVWAEDDETAILLLLKIVKRIKEEGIEKDINIGQSDGNGLIVISHVDTEKNKGKR